jgi:aminopeptidase N
MTRYVHGLAAGLLLVSTVLPASAQSPSPEARPAPARRPFAKPGAPRQTGRIREIDIKHIKAELTLNLQKKEVSGKVTHRLTPLHPYLTRIDLDCGSKLKISQVAAGPQAAPCKFSTHDQKLSITLDKPYGPDDTIDLAISYSGAPGSGLHFITVDPAYPERPAAIWTQGEAEDNHNWLPCYDYPNDRITSEMIITVARPLSVVSNGALVDTKENPDGTRTFHWKMEHPHSTYLITVAAGEFVAFHDRVENLSVDYYVNKSVSEATARRFMGKTPAMIRFFNETTGQSYPYPKYAQVCLPEFGGGMENTSATSMTDASLLDEIEGLERSEDGLVAHELAHQWFGDLLTCKDWSHVWLNEGFASYFDPLFAEHDRGEDEFRITMEEELQRYVRDDREYRRPIVETRYSSPMEMFDSMTYAKGGCVLHMLRCLVGDDAWWKGIRGYVAKHKFDVVETEDFRKAMEEATGKDLKWFFDQWLYKAGHPELKVRWHYEDSDKTARVQVEQTQKQADETPLFRLPTTLELTGDGGKSRVVPIVVDKASQEFVIPADAKPRMVLIDPRCCLIKELDFAKSDTENIFQLEHASCVLCRLKAARALARESKEKPEVRKALEKAWKKERSVLARTEMVALIGGVEGTPRRVRRMGPARQADAQRPEGDEAFRQTLIEASRDKEARVRVAAIRALARLKKEPDAEVLLRQVWTNPKEAYGARRAALRGLVTWKVKDADQLLASALKLPDGKHTLAASGLELLLEQPGTKARELAALYVNYGQPRALRSAALDAFDRLAKDDPALQDVVVPLVDDPDRMVRFQALRLARSLNLKKALPALEARLTHENFGFTGFSGFGARQVQETINALKGGNKEATASGGDAAKNSFDLEKQAEELEARARDLRKRIEALRPKLSTQ